jgi:hypothetical protein
MSGINAPNLGCKSIQGWPPWDYTVTGYLELGASLRNKRCYGQHSEKVTWDGHSWYVQISTHNVVCPKCGSPLPAGTPWLHIHGTQGPDYGECCFPCYESDVLGLITRPTGQLKMVQPRRPAGHFTQDGSHHQAIYSSLPGEAHTIKLSVQYHCLQDMPDSMSEEEPEEEPEEGPAKVIGVIYIYIYIYIRAPTSSVSLAVATHVGRTHQY